MVNQTQQLVRRSQRRSKHCIASLIPETRFLIRNRVSYLELLLRIEIVVTQKEKNISDHQAIIQSETALEPLYFDRQLQSLK